VVHERQVRDNMKAMI